MPDLEILEIMKNSQEQNMAAFEVLADSIGKMLKKQEMRDYAEEEAKKKEEEEKMNHEKENVEKAKWDTFSKSVYDYINKSLADTSESITKTLSDTVIAAVKQVYMGMDVDATKAHAVDGGDVKLPPQKWPMSTREHRDVDKEDAAKLRTDTKSVQNPIQAMQKHDVMYKDEDMPMEDENKLEEYPHVEDEMVDKPTLDDMQKAFAELKAMKDEMNNIKKSYKEDVKKNVNEELKKFGIHQEKSYTTKVKSPEIGGSEMPVQKSMDEKDVVGQLVKVNTGDLMNEWLKSKGFAVGNTNSVPQEVMINAS